ncbi:sigma-54-dependent Fis family transcriptional regulator [Desulfobacca acetoxidans]|uniref:Sigma54 specific transcriptional regulator with PAS/PAC sensor, Fis family n=1 Tax=Desulfobacca acetoxidans (strain ATCC 700848 / DSM 11109 / ASRB2) TaxID=880072 RepID=F2NF47_DESAR|nr:sigma-54-dependent Fis family transcriptional regulator [Desulfobacca acetoxidans]AEB08387.1 sigma54 specific transcriptional regulator with PAS/PAC sensor, Fis family [Desulfobacca acetoxidans DSM 11109]
MTQLTEASLVRIFNSVTDPFVVYGRDYRILMVNPAFAATFQRPSHNLIGRRCYEVLYNRLDICEDCHIKEIFATGEPRTREILLTLPDNSQRHFEVRSHPVKDADGNVIQAFEHSQDITERKSLELQVRTSEEKYRTIVEMAREGIFILDYKARFTFANECLAQMLGYTPEEFLGRTLCSLMDEETRIRGKAQFNQNRKGLPLAQELRLNRRDGSPLHCLVSITPLMVGNDFFGSIGIVTDISQLKQVETELRAAKDALAAQAWELQKTQHQLETLLEISRQVNAKGSLPEIFNYIRDISRKIFTDAEPIFLILDSGRNAFLTLDDCPTKIAAPLGRMLRQLEKGEAAADLLHYLDKIKNSQIITKTQNNSVPPQLRQAVASYPSWFGLPLMTPDQCIGFFLLGSNTALDYALDDLRFFQTLFAQISGYIRQLVVREAEIRCLLQKVSERASYGEIIGQCGKMQEVYELIDLVAGSDATVFITGENGTGKELVARAIHERSHRRKGPFIVANCSAYSPTLLESELFGHEKGAFTGAIRQKKGRIERAQGGTLFLDEIGDIAAATQILLLRFLQDHCFERVGGEDTIMADVRILAATNKDLYKEAEAGRFREDLYYRLNVISIPLPALRERKEDIPLLAQHFLERFNAKEGKQIQRFSPNTLQVLMDFDWPGNVRQLENAVSHAVIVCQGDVIGRKHLPRFLKDKPEETVSTSLAEQERRLILRVLKESNWNKHDAARRLKLSRSTLYSKIRRYNLAPLAAVV